MLDIYRHGVVDSFSSGRVSLISKTSKGRSLNDAVGALVVRKCGMHIWSHGWSGMSTRVYGALAQLYTRRAQWSLRTPPCLYLGTWRRLSISFDTLCVWCIYFQLWTCWGLFLIKVVKLLLIIIVLLFYLFIFFFRKARGKTRCFKFITCKLAGPITINARTVLKLVYQGSAASTLQRSGLQQFARK